MNLASNFLNLAVKRYFKILGGISMYYLIFLCNFNEAVIKLNAKY